MCKISAVKNLCSWKSGPKFTKIGDSLLYTMPLTMPNFIVLGQTMYEKSITIFFTSFTILAPKGTPWSKFNNLGPYVYSNLPLSTSQISSRSDNPSARYLLPNFVDFAYRMTHKKTVNDMTPHTMPQQLSRINRN